MLLISEGFERDYIPDDPRFMSWWTTSDPATNPVYVASNPANVPILSNEISGFADNAQQYSPHCVYPGGCSGTNGQTFDVNADNYWYLFFSISRFVPRRCILSFGCRDAWASYVGDERWGSATVKEQRKWTETYSGSGNRACHGTSGGIQVTAPWPEPTGNALINGISSVLSIPIVNDTICEGTNVGVGAAARNIDPVTFARQNTYFQVVKPLLNAGNPNLRVVFGATAVGLTYNFDRTSVECLTYIDAEGVTQTVCPNKEIILTMGTIGTARFVQLQGFGNCSQLASVGITPCVYDNPNIGQHMKVQV